MNTARDAERHPVGGTQPTSADPGAGDRAHRRAARAGSVTRVCPTCGYANSYTSPAVAEYHHRRHSCAKQQRRTAAAAGRTGAGGPVRDCAHRNRPHRHGTRTAYVKDACRCTPCRHANTTAAQATRRAQTFGCWQPYIDATAVREHIQSLREVGIGIDRIATLSGLSASHIRALLYPTGSGRPPTAKVRANTAQRVLAVAATPANRAPRRLLDATSTRRRLHALIAIGWPLPVLAVHLHRTLSNVRRTMQSELVTAATAEAVADLFEQLWNQQPPAHTPSQRAAISAARAHAAAHGWPPPLGWDDIDTDPEPAAPATTAAREIDEIAIERALAGDGIALADLTAPEQQEVVRLLTERGHSLRDIATQLHTTTRTVSRRRATAA